MPEGDTVYKIAEFLDQALRGCRVEQVQLRPVFGLSSGPRQVAGVASAGKHLYVSFADGMQLRSHLGMYGSWHRYRRGERWRKPAWQASIVIQTESLNFVCFNAKEVQWLHARGFERVDRDNRLGPDLIRDSAALDAILPRARALLPPDTAVVDLLLDQRIAAGIGNVYKSELLFLERCSPSARLCDLGDDAVFALYLRAAELLGENLGGGPRTTRDNLDRRGRLWVYGRAGLPCLRCGAQVRRVSLGANPRSTYWCAGCQSGGEPDARSAFAVAAPRSGRRLG